MKKTIGDLVKQFNLSRSTLIYYDKINLLKPSSRNQANYRLYSDKDVTRLKNITMYKDAGLSLDDITRILNEESNQTTKILEQRLVHLNLELKHLRLQQQLILKLLGDGSKLPTGGVMTKQRWVKILRSSGMDENAMRQWHIEFERELPEAHTDFLISLGIEEGEIRSIKSWSYGKA